MSWVQVTRPPPSTAGGCEGPLATWQILRWPTPGCHSAINTHYNSKRGPSRQHPPRAPSQPYASIRSPPNGPDQNSVLPLSHARTGPAPGPWPGARPRAPRGCTFRPSVSAACPPPASVPLSPGAWGVPPAAPNPGALCAASRWRVRSPAPPSSAFPKPPAAGHPQRPRRPLPHEGWTSRNKDPTPSQATVQERGKNQE